MTRCNFFVTSLLMLTASLLPLSCTTTSAPTESGNADSRVRAAVTTWAAAMQSQQVDAAVACYSDSFQHAEWGDKNGVRSAIEQARVIGYLDGMQIDTSAMQVSREEGYYRAGPVRMTGGFGDDLLTLHLREEGGAMRIVGSERISVAQSQ